MVECTQCVAQNEKVMMTLVVMMMMMKGEEIGLLSVQMTKCQSVYLSVCHYFLRNMFLEMLFSIKKCVD